jgi:23S rRNA pseudouridine1911/1915/1917 synthase
VKKTEQKIDRKPAARAPKPQMGKKDDRRDDRKRDDKRAGTGKKTEPVMQKRAPSRPQKEPEPKYTGEMDKAASILAKQLAISVGKAKEMIDRGLVFSHGKKIMIARAMMPITTEFKVERLQKPRVIFENADIVVVDKPPFMTSDEVEEELKATLIHRLDKDTSGVLALAKNEEYLAKAIEAFKKKEVYKEYIAVVQGIVAEGGVIDEPLLIKKGTSARAMVDRKYGKSAKTIYEPLEMMAKKTKLKVVIETGRTHQIRAHMKFLKHPILGDVTYGGAEAKRMMLHSKILRLLGREYTAEEPKDFVLRE